MKQQEAKNGASFSMSCRPVSESGTLRFVSKFLLNGASSEGNFTENRLRSSAILCQDYKSHLFVPNGYEFGAVFKI